MADDRVYVHCNTCSNVNKSVSVMLLKKVGYWNITDSIVKVEHFFSEHSFHDIVLFTENESHVLSLD